MFKNAMNASTLWWTKERTALVFTDCVLLTSFILFQRSYARLWSAFSSRLPSDEVPSYAATLLDNLPILQYVPYVCCAVLLVLHASARRQSTLPSHICAGLAFVALAVFAFLAMCAFSAPLVTAGVRL